MNVQIFLKTFFLLVSKGQVDEGCKFDYIWQKNSSHVVIYDREIPTQ